MLETGDKVRFATRLRLRLTVSALAVLGFALLVGPGGAQTTTVAAGHARRLGLPGQRLGAMHCTERALRRDRRFGRLRSHSWAPK